jgi:3-oxoadipate enol-lactonase
MNTLQITVNENRVSYIDEGSKDSPTIIFIHGFPFNKTMWAGQVEMLKDNFRVIAYDTRGHGESEIGKVDFSIDLFVNDLIGLMDVLKIEKALLCGLSMGGYIVFRAIAKHQHRFAALILCDTQCAADTPEGKEKRMKAIDSIETNGVEMYAQASLINLFASGSFQTKPDMVAFIRDTIIKTPIETLCKTLMALANREETCTTLSQIKIPVQIIVGREDKITPITSAQLMQERIKHSGLSIIEQAGHLTNLENPSDFNYELKKFISPFSKNQ